MSIDTSIKSIPISQLEECIASAITKATNGSKLNCYISKVETTGMLDSVKIKLSLSNDRDDIPF